MQEMVTTYPAVPSGQNGSGIAGVQRQYFNIYGQLTWSMDPRGAITYQAYDLATGAVGQQILDVDTTQVTNEPSGWTTVAGWGQHLVTDFLNDAQGRTLQARGPWHDVQLRERDTTATSIRRVQFTAYLDEAHEVRQATGYLTGGGELTDYTIVGAVTLTQSDASGRTVNQIQVVRTCQCGPLSATEPFPQEKWSRWTHFVYDTWARLFEQRVYHRIPLRGEGQEGANYLATVYGYDILGRQNRVIEPSGTIRRTVFDARSLIVSNWTGTDDAGATANDPTGAGATGNNMRLVSAQQYDDGESGGDGNLTQVTQPVDDNSAHDRVTSYGYDYRDRRTSTTQSDGTTTWITVTIYDNLDRPLQNTKYQGSVSGPNQIARNRAFYDLLGRTYRNEVDGVDITTGDITQTLSSQTWYDLGGNIIKASAAGATSFTKTVYDALNRAITTYTACVPGTAGVPTGDSNSVTADTVLEQNETLYDRGGNVIQSNQRQRFHDATGTGALHNVSTEPKARVSSVAVWPDAIGRPRNTADYGTNGGAALVRPAVAPARSDTVLVSTNRFKDDGDANATIDPMGLETRWENDQAGRRVRLVENYVEGCPERSRISEYIWHASGQLERLTLLNDETGDQVTRWAFGTTLADSAIADNNLLRVKIYPESDDRPAPLDAGPDGIYARLEYTYNRAGQALTFTDADGTLHAYAYDKLGRLLADSITTLGPDLDDAVLRIGRTYETRGMLATVTSYNAANGGSVVNESAFTYDAFGNLIADQQSHSGAVTGSTPTVGYSYADGSANTTRRTAITYPNGRILETQYGETDSVSDHFNRVSAVQLTDEETTLVDYQYVGVAWQIRVGYAGPAVELTYQKQPSKPVGDAGDPYNGYDRFGRTVDLRWQKTTPGKAQLERLQYGFDRDSRRTWRRRCLTTGEDNAYSYDGLSQVTQSAVGNLNLNETAISGVPVSTEAWNYDPTGNWHGYQTEANGTTTLDQYRVHDKGNRLMQIAGDPHPILVDRVGRMRQVPPDASGNWNDSLKIQWDAWSRITEIKRTSDNGTLGTYTYDGQTRRLTRTVEGVTWHTYYSDAWRPLEERKETQTTAARQYLWGVRHRDDLARQDRATTDGGELDETRYVLMDYYSPASITDETGTITERYAFSAFGIRRILAPDFESHSASECAFEFAFHGQFLDSESGFLNYGHRYCSVEIGRWLCKDPIAESGGLNIYSYVDNSPENRIDRLGLASDINYNVKKNKLECGGSVAAFIDIYLSSPSLKNGYIVQQNERTNSQQDCKGKIDESASYDAQIFWEAFAVSAGSDRPANTVGAPLDVGGGVYSDISSFSPPKNTCGFYKVTKTARFFELSDTGNLGAVAFNPQTGNFVNYPPNVPGWSNTGSSPTGYLPGTWDMPSFWNSGSPSEKVVTITVKLECCVKNTVTVEVS